MRTIMLALSLILLTSCIDVDVQQIRPDPSVKPVLTGKDCVHLIILPIMIGRVTTEAAMANAGREETFIDPVAGRQTRVIASPITRIHSIETNEFGFPFYGSKCVTVTGE